MAWLVSISAANSPVASITFSAEGVKESGVPQAKSAGVAVSTPA